MEAYEILTIQYCLTVLVIYELCLNSACVVYCIHVRNFRYQLKAV